MAELADGKRPGRAPGGGRAGATTGEAREIDRLRSRVAALEHLLLMQERAVLEQASHLRRAAEESARRAEDLARSERALQEKTGILQSILDSMSDGVAVADAGGRLVHFNRAAAQLLGLGPVDAPSAEWPERYHFREADRVTPFPADRLPLVRALRGESVDDQEVFVARPGGPGLWLSINSRAIRDAGGRIAGAVSVLRDVTRRVKAEAALDRRTHELQRSNAELEEFAYVASHDLQEPLRVVRSCAEILERRCRPGLDEDAGRLLDTVLDNSGRMMELVSDLLSLSRVGTTRAEPEACDAGALCDRAVASLRDMIAGERATVVRRDLPRVNAVPAQIVQVFQNLIANAVKYHDERPPRVEVLAEIRGDEAVFAVRDEGIGMEPADLERIFVMFTRLHGRREYPGTGIGLALCRRIIERHGGRIWAESAPGRGSTFRFTLPLAETTRP